MLSALFQIERKTVGGIEAKDKSIQARGSHGREELAIATI